MVNKFISAVLVFSMFIESISMGPVFAEEKIITQSEEPQPIVEIVEEEPDVIVSEVIEVVEKPKKESKPKKKPKKAKKPKKESPSLPLTDAEIDLIALVTMAEAEGESELGKRLVIDVILNRVESERFPNTVNGVIYARNQFECMTNGRVNRCEVRKDIRKLVVEELQSRTRSDIHYFRMSYYHKFGKPVMSEGNHYFSTY